MSTPIQTIERDGYTVKVYRIEDDMGGDTRYLGTCAIAPAKYPAWDRALKRVLWRKQDYHRLKEVEAAQHWDHAREYRYVHEFQDVYGVGRLDAEKYIRQNVARLESYGEAWSFVGIVAKAFRAGIQLGNAGVWGVETDADEGHFAELTKEVVGEAVDEARANLAKLCASAQ